MSARLSLKEWLARPAEARDDGRRFSDNRDVGPAKEYTLCAIWIEQPVTVGTTLRGLGLSLREAHDALNRLAVGEIVIGRLDGDVATVTGALATVGVAAREVAVVDSALGAGLAEEASP